MKEITLEVEIITPTLMGGGFGQNDNIRPSEIKGMMRYWFRAIAGSVLGNNIEEIKKVEDRLFGSQTTKSPFRLLISNKKDLKIEKNLTLQKAGAKYLGFTINVNKERVLNVIKEGIFEISFLFNNNLSAEERRLILLSFYLATALGGFGLRSRRGFGSWQIKGSKVKIGDFEFEKYKEEDINKAIKISIENLISLIKKEKTETDIPVINTFFDGKYNIEIVRQRASSWEDVLDNLGRYYRGFRINPNNPQKANPSDKKATNDFKIIMNAFRENKKSINLVNPSFGLNIQYPSGKFSVELQKENKSLRRASQLFVSIKKENDEYSIILSNFYSQFKPHNDKYKVIVKGKDIIFVNVDDKKYYEYRNNLINFLKTNWGR
ncbi:hypothetical protein JCM14244_07900 [Venenivibrio stagnispumantis]|uniref:CRISPR type III-B/RAMP module RAMP protein Cmr1 n=1 Tax=Venenivibrio stagnispumantis TaxID=407998 RepID=A0AA45WNW8_9AQUI|nr:type III-B CRISPR module RAMP protein Cmr1 [Venenivibrio stagnispumantis]MCW4573979.1 type III-B CRISPR module RAMP protein Cmr1 [Venenivibrio stagnispumantis]SMP19290.1 CRISPR type III-B/RAMP module RAMP protein Cmr1 [Venenivibrio stagnispumantis]